MSKSTTSKTAGRFIRSVQLAEVADVRGYPFDLPVVSGLRAAGGLDLAAGVTFLVG